jgi:hypothetical protein
LPRICVVSPLFVLFVRSSQRGRGPDAYEAGGSARPGALTGLALIGPLSTVVRPEVAAAAPNDFVTMSDGVSIAVNVRMPTNYVPGQRYPTVFEMSGYDGGSANRGTLAKDVGVPPGTPVPVDDSRQLTDYLNGEYVTVHASVRGNGCSSGEFDLFSWRSALDGSAPGVNTILQGPDTPTRIMLPMAPLRGVRLGPPLPCGAQEAVRCVEQPG